MVGWALWRRAVVDVVLGLGVAYVSAQLRQRLGAWLPRIERASALLLVAVGLRQLAGWWGAGG